MLRATSQCSCYPSPVQPGLHRGLSMRVLSVVRFNGGNRWAFGQLVNIIKDRYQKEQSAWPDGKWTTFPAIVTLLLLVSIYNFFLIHRQGRWWFENCPLRASDVLSEPDHQQNWCFSWKRLKEDSAGLKPRVNAQFLMFFQTWMVLFPSLMLHRFQDLMCRSATFSGDHNTSGCGQIKEKINYWWGAGLVLTTNMPTHTHRHTHT